jgi:hypothetical protein
MCDQEETAQKLIEHLNRTAGRSYSIIARPDEADRTRPRWDYTLQDASSRDQIGLEVTTAHRTRDARGADARWLRVHARVQEGAQGRVTGNFIIQTPEVIYVRPNTEEDVVQRLTDAIVRMCDSLTDATPENSGVEPIEEDDESDPEETVRTESGDILVRVSPSPTNSGLGFVRGAAPGAYVASMKADLEETILGKRDQLAAIIAEGLPPHLLIKSVDFAVVSVTDVAYAALDIIRDHSLGWRRAYVIQLGPVLTIDPQGGTVTW